VIVLDANVISESLRRAPDPHVIEWIDAQPIETLYLSAISVAELRFGIAALPEGRRREGLQTNLETRILPRFAGRVLPFDLVASQAYGELMSRARAAGAAIPVADGYIAATAVSRRMAVATRDTAPFHTAGVAVVNPWTA